MDVPKIDFDVFFRAKVHVDPACLCISSIYTPAISIALSVCIMHARALEISWHEKTCVWSIDASTCDGVTRLVTAGSDRVARIWRLPSSSPSILSASASIPSYAALNGGDINIEWLSDLRAHTSNVNAVRFAPGGNVLATAADGGEIVLWKLDPLAVPDKGQVSAPLVPGFGAPAGADAPKERWTCLRNLRGHSHDVLDMSWSPCGGLLASASVDNQVMIWNVSAKTNSPRPYLLRQFNNFVQGVAFSPDGTRLGTLGNDRTLRIFTRSKLAKNGTTTWKPTASVNNFGKTAKLFVDDMNSKNLVRRLAWSPDGNLLACPSGLDVSSSILHDSSGNNNNTEQINDSSTAALTSSNGITIAPAAAGNENSNSGKPDPVKSNASSGKKLYAAHIFSRNAPQVPLFQCGNLPKPVISVRFSPILYRLRTCQQTPPDKGAAVPLNYRMIFAVLCTDALFLYDTQCTKRPIARVSGLHLAEHTDGCWTPDGRSFFISSTDGYVSCTSFEAGELGEPLPKAEYPLIRFIPAPSPAAPEPPLAPIGAPAMASSAVRAVTSIGSMEKT